MMGRINDKRSQQEIVGFALIIIIVVIVGVIFLGIYLRKDKPIVTDDAEINNFIMSSLRYTTDCYKDYDTDFKSLGDLVKYCYDGTKVTCMNSQTGCQAVNSTYSWMLKKLWPTGKDRPIRYAKVAFYYQQNLSDENSRTPFGEKLIIGNLTSCGTIKSGHDTININSGDLVVELEICRTS